MGGQISFIPRAAVSLRCGNNWERTHKNVDTLQANRIKLHQLFKAATECRETVVSRHGLEILLKENRLKVPVSHPVCTPYGRLDADRSHTVGKGRSRPCVFTALLLGGTPPAAPQFSCLWIMAMKSGLPEFKPQLCTIQLLDLGQVLDPHSQELGLQGPDGMRPTLYPPHLVGGLPSDPSSHQKEVTIVSFSLSACLAAHGWRQQES